MLIKNSYWFSGAFGTIGIVTGEDENTGVKKAYIGTAQGFDEAADTKFIAERGSPLVSSILGQILKDFNS